MSKNSQPAQPSPASTKSRSGTIRLVAIIVTAALLVCAIPTAILGVRNIRIGTKFPYQFTGNAQQESIFLNDMSEENQDKRVKKMHRHGQIWKFDYYCADKLMLEDLSEYGMISFANVYSNDCVLVLSIYNEDGAMIYQSGGVSPGKIIQRIRLFYSMEAGTHVCRAYVAGYDRTTGERIGVQYSKLTINIGG